MYIPEFWVGVCATLLVEVAGIFVLGLMNRRR